MQKLPKHILVIRLSAMGDVAMTAPVIRAFTEQYPNVRLTVLTREGFSAIFRDLKNVSVYHIHVLDRHNGIRGLYKLSKELKKLNIDAIADLHNVLRSKVIKLFLNKRPFLQIDKGRSEKKALISGKRYSQLKSTHQRYAEVFKNLGYPIDLEDPKFPEKANLNPQSTEMLGEFKTLIGIAPFAAYKSKTYSFKQMKHVLKLLDDDCKIVLFGGVEEKSQLDGLIADQTNVINLAGKLTLSEELDVISNLDIMLSMDSANAHLAAMLGVQVVTLWGVTHPFTGFYPYNQSVENALLANKTQFPKVPTSVYGNKFPKGYENAINSIEPERIVSKLKSLLTHHHNQH